MLTLTGARWTQRPRGLPTPLAAVALAVCLAVLPACAPAEAAPETSASTSETSTSQSSAESELLSEASSPDSPSPDSSVPPASAEPSDSPSDPSAGGAGQQVTDALATASDLAEQAAYHLADHAMGEIPTPRTQPARPSVDDTEALVAPRATTPEPPQGYTTEQALIDAVATGGYPTDPSGSGYVQVSGPQAIVTVVNGPGKRERASVCYDSPQRMFYVVSGLRCLKPGDA